MTDAPDNGGPTPPAGDGSDFDEPGQRREGALEQLKKQLAARETPMPQVEGYPLRKARKILALSGIDVERVRVKLVENVAPRSTVVQQRPRAGQMVDLEDPNQRIEVWAAEQSVVGYLPQLYQRNDLNGRSFVRDLLWVLQHIQFQTEEKLLNLEQYFDPHEAPSRFLEYLSSWVALTMDTGWPEFKKRSLIKKAVELYHLRGTPRGLRVYLRLFTGVDPVIHENVWPFDGVVVGGTCTVGVDTVLMHSVNRAHAFVVHIPLPIDEVDLETILKIHRIIEQEKPVHTDYYLTFAEPEEQELDTGITVGVTSTIGVDTWIQGGDEDYFDPLGGMGDSMSSEE
ncbi:phage tail protein [Planctomycetota bacterium]|nr:phage tail protein [Planctomycetota bacterium]